MSAWLELPPGYRAPDADDAAYRQSSRFDLSDGADEADSDDAKWSAYGREDNLSRQVPWRGRVRGFH
jgi:hypothetical protein